MPVQQTTLSELQDEMVQRWGGTPFWTADDALQGINEAMRFWNLLVGEWKEPATLATSASSYFYTVPSTLTFQFRVRWNGIPLQPTSVRGLDLSTPNWRAQSVSSGGTVPTRPTRYAPAGLTSFVIWPRDVVATNSLVIDGVAKTPVLANPGDYIDLGDEERGTLLGEATHIVAFKAQGPTWKKTFALHQAFLRAAVDRNARIKANVLFRRMMGLDSGRPLDPLRLPVSQQALQLFTGALEGQGG